MARIPFILLCGFVTACRGLLSSIKTRRSNREEVLQGCLEEYASSLDKVRVGLGRSARELKNVNLSTVQTSDRSVIFNVGVGTTATHFVANALTSAGLHGAHYGRRDYVARLHDILGTCYPRPWLECKAEGMTSHSPVPASRKAQCYNELRSYNFSGLPDDLEWLSDSPVSELFVHLFRAFPNAKFILSKRRAKEWVHRRLKKRASPLAVLQEPCGQFLHDFSFSENNMLFRLHNKLVHCAVDKSKFFYVNVFKNSNVSTASKLARFVQRTMGQSTRA